MLPAKKSQSWFPSIFNDFFRNDWMDKTGLNAPAVNIKESDDNFEVEIAAPGLTKDDFNIRIEGDNQLVISMEKKEEKNSGDPEGDQGEEKKKEEGRYLRREFYYSRFQQSLMLPENVDKDQIQAKVDNGVLKIDIPKKEALPESPQTKQIEVK